MRILVVYLFIEILTSAVAQGQEVLRAVTGRYVREHYSQANGLGYNMCNSIVETDHQSFYIANGAFLDLLDGSGISPAYYAMKPGGQEFENLVFMSGRLFASDIAKPIVHVLKPDARKIIELDRTLFTKNIAVKSCLFNNSVLIVSDTWTQPMVYQWLHPDRLTLGKPYRLPHHLRLLDLTEDGLLLAVDRNIRTVYLIHHEAVVDSMDIGHGNRLLQNCIVQSTNEILYYTSVGHKILPIVLEDAGDDEKVHFARYFTPQKKLVYKTAGELFEVENGRRLRIDRFAPEVFQAYVDRSNNLWLCTNSGVYNFFHRKIQQLEFNHVNPDVGPVDLVKKQQGRYLFPSSYNGFLLSDNLDSWREDSLLTALWAQENKEKFTPWTQKIVTYGNKVFSALGTLLVVSDGNHIDTIRIDPVELRISDLAIDSARNQLYFISYKSLYCYALASHTVKKLATIVHDVKENGYNFNLMLTRSGAVMIGNKKLYRYDPDNDALKIFMDKSPAEAYYYFCEDADGRVWIGNHQKIWLYDGHKPKLVTSFITPKNINGIVTYKNWLIVSKGGQLQFVDKAKYIRQNIVNIFPFAENVGLNPFKGIMNGLLVDEENNSIFWACIDKLYKIEPDEVIANTEIVTTPYIRSILFLRTGVNRPLSADTLSAIRLVSPLGINNIAFEIGYSHYIKKPKIRYRLHGMEDEWRFSDFSKIEYYDLPPGEYRLETQISTFEELWGESVWSKEIFIPPLWYQTRLFKLACLLVVGCLLYFLYRFREYHVRKIKEERKSIGYDMHDNLGAGISALKLNAEFIKHKITQGNPAGEDIDELLRISDDMNVSMREILWSLQNRNDSIGSLMTYTRDYVENFLRRSGIKSHFHQEVAEPGRSFSFGRNYHLMLCIKEAITNVYKHSKAQNVVVRYLQSKNSFVVEIQDDGIGVGASLHAGNGLKSMQMRMARIRGRFEIQDCDKGTKVVLKLWTGGILRRSFVDFFRQRNKK